MKKSAKEQVLEVIEKNPGCDSKKITESVDYGVDTVRKACADLVKEGKITKKEIALTGALKKYLFNPKGTLSREEVIKKAKESATKSSEERNKLVPKNREKVAFKGEEYGKAKLVKAVVVAFVKANPTMKFEELAKLMNFDKNGRRVYPKYDVIRPISDEAVKSSIDGKYKRYHVNDIQTSADGVKFAICREWGVDNIDKDFICPIAKEQLKFELDTFKA